MDSISFFTFTVVVLVVIVLLILVTWLARKLYPMTLYALEVHLWLYLAYHFLKYELADEEGKKKLLELTKALYEEQQKYKNIRH